MAAIADTDVVAIAYNAYVGYAAAAGKSVPAFAAVPAAVKAEWAAIATDVVDDNALTAPEVHQTLIETRKAASWTYGLIYVAGSTKTDPIMQDFDALPELTRIFWYLLVATAVAMTDFIGYDEPA